MNETFIFQDYLQDVSVCDEIINFHKTNTSLQGPGGTSGGLDKQSKDSTDVSLYYPNPLLTSYSDQLQQLTQKYFDKYKFAYPPGQWGILEGVNIQHYGLGGGFFAAHSERNGGVFPMSKRFLVFMTYLNDVTDGGQTEFYYQDLAIQPKKGLTVIWPTDWTHTHRGVTSHTQEKYIITGWLSYLDQ